MNIAAVQLDIVWEDKPANFSRVRSLLAEARPAPGSLIVLPEMFATGFSMNLNVTRQNGVREDESFLAALAREHRAFVLGGVVSRGSWEKGRNEAVAFSPKPRRAATPRPSEISASFTGTAKVFPAKSS